MFLFLSPLSRDSFPASQGTRTLAALKPRALGSAWSTAHNLGFQCSLKLRATATASLLVAAKIPGTHLYHGGCTRYCACRVRGNPYTDPYNSQLLCACGKEHGQVHIFQSRCVCVSVCARNGQLSTLGALPREPSTSLYFFIFEQGFSLAWSSPRKQGCLACKLQGSFCLHLSIKGFTGSGHSAWLFT